MSAKLKNKVDVYVRYVNIVIVVNCENLDLHTNLVTNSIVK